MQLFYKKSGKGQTLIILHGLLGSLDNWQTLAKYLSEHFEVYLVDQRNHGHSPHSNVWNYEVMAEDLHELMEENKLSNVILLGHSMGGKTAMTYAAKHPEKISKIIVVDMGLKFYPVHHTLIIETLESVNVDTLRSRKEAEAILIQRISEASTVQFLLKNLYWLDTEDKKMAWRFNLPVIKINIENVGTETSISNCLIPTLFIRGENSDYIKNEDWPAIKEKFTHAELITISEAGHWVHADRPAEFLKKVLEFCRK